MEIGEYSIPLRQLPNGKHSFFFECHDDLFNRFEESLVPGGKLQVKVDVKKSDEMMTLDCDIKGTLRVQCDICLGLFDYEIDECGDLVTLRMGDHFEEIDDNLYEVDSAEESFDLSQLIYEMVVVMLPLQCEHPLDENGNSTCDPEMLKELDKYLVTSEDEVKERMREAQAALSNGDDEDAIDPRWAALRALKDNADDHEEAQAPKASKSKKSGKK